MRKQSQMPHNFTKFTIFFYCLKLKTVALNEHYVSKGNFLTNSFPLLSGIWLMDTSRALADYLKKKKKQRPSTR